jgi:hypothetical protein
MYKIESVRLAEPGDHILMVILTAARWVAIGTTDLPVLVAIYNA